MMFNVTKIIRKEVSVMFMKDRKFTRDEHVALQMNIILLKITSPDRGLSRNENND